MERGMTISKRLYLNFGAILAIVFALLAANLLAVHREHIVSEETKRSTEMAAALENVRVRIMQNHLSLQTYLLSGDRREAENIAAGMRDLERDVQHANASAASEQERTMLQRLLFHERRWNEEFAKPLIDKRNQVDSGNSTVADLQIYYLQLNPATWIKTSNSYIDDVEAANTNHLREQQQMSSTATAVTTAVSIIGTLMAVVLGLMIAFRTAKSITMPLNQLITVAREIGDSGDLEHKIDIERRDEIGELARTFSNMVAYLKEMAGISAAIAGGDLSVEVKPRSSRDTLAHAFMKMVEGLRRIVSSVRDAASQVAGGSNQVAGASDESARISVQSSSAIDEVTSTMHEMSMNVQNMVKNTQVQASSVSETSASIDEMVASIQRVADTAKVLLEISNRSRQEVRNGIGIMEKTTDGLNRINGSIHNSSAIIGELGSRADNIGKIVEVIDDLAEQTNLLALNAAIEAARAGEHGLGFAVVADEVRKLAEKSAQSTKEISELIQSIQKEARRAVDNMEKNTAIVNEGLTLGGDLNGALRKISDVVGEVYKFAQEIGAATTEQSHGSSQIARATSKLNEITHEINSAVEEQASGAQGVVRAMERMRELVQRQTSGSTELAASAEQMSKMSRSLLEAMDRFRVENGNGSRAQSGGNGHEAAAAARLAGAGRY